MKKERLEKHYRNIPVDILDQIRELYSMDFEMFEYDKYLEVERNSSWHLFWSFQILHVFLLKSTFSPQYKLFMQFSSSLLTCIAKYWPKNL